MQRLFQFWSYLCPPDTNSLSCPSTWRWGSFWQGAKKGVAAQGLHRPGLQHRWWGGWRRNLCLLHPGRRASWPEWWAEEGRQDSLGQYLNTRALCVPISQHQLLKVSVSCQRLVDQLLPVDNAGIYVVCCLKSQQTSALLKCPWTRQ